MTSPTLILHSHKYADDRLIVETYTEAAGPVSFIVRINHGGRQAAVPHTIFQPLALLEIRWEEHARTTLVKPTAARPLHIPHSITTHPVKSALALFLAEFLRAALRQEPPSPQVFNYIDQALRWLETVEDRPIANVHIAFLIRLATLLGFSPTPEELLPICPHQHTDAIPTLLRMNLANQHLYQFTRQQRTELLRIILLYYRQHLPAFPQMKSVEVLSLIFD